MYDEFWNEIVKCEHWDCPYHTCKYHADCYDDALEDEEMKICQCYYDL